MIARILLAYDGSDNALRALDVAAELASKPLASLHIVYVQLQSRPPEDLIAMANVHELVTKAQRPRQPQATCGSGAAYDMLRGNCENAPSAQVITALGEHLIDEAKQMCADLGVTRISTSLRLGDIAEQILTAAREHGSDVIVIGTHGLGTPKDTLLGSVSQRVLHDAKQSVVAVT